MIEPMSAKQYILRETVVSIFINIIINSGVFLLVFGLAGPIPVWGMGKLAFGVVPQAFMIGLMITLISGSLTTMKLRKGRIARYEGWSMLPRSLIGSALTVAVASAVICAGLACALLFLVAPSELSWLNAFIFNLIFSGLVAFVVTPVVLRSAMRA